MKSSIILLGFLMGVFARPEPPISGSYLPSHPDVSVYPSYDYGHHDYGHKDYDHHDYGHKDYDHHDYGHKDYDHHDYGNYDHDKSHKDQKHVYFYAAPDDEANAHFRIYVAPSSHKNTKIIFVKAPSYGGIKPEIIAPPSHAEDKTKIYVLYKKPNHDKSITIPSSLGVKQAKPEVFFIKYKNEHDASAAVSQGRQGGSVGTHLENLGSEESFIRTLESKYNGDNGGDNGGYKGGDKDDDNDYYKHAHGKYGPPTTYGTPDESGPYKK